MQGNTNEATTADAAIDFAGQFADARVVLEALATHGLSNQPRLGIEGAMSRLRQTTDLRRLGASLVVLVLVKIAFLTVIWLVAIRPYPRPDTRPDAVNAHLAPIPPAEKGQP